jgi:Tfp pilus assembly protein PilN
VKKRPGLGDSLEARFRPSLYWGAEFLAQKVRLCAFGEREGRPAPLHTFEGDYPEAAAFAAAHGIAYEGLNAAVSHLPCKIEPLEPIPEGGDEDIAPQVDRLKPQGLPAASMEAQEFYLGADRHLILAREDALRAFTESLPAGLGALWNLSPSSLALLSHFEADRAQGHCAALSCEAEYTHLLFFRDGSLSAYAKVFTGWEDAGRDPAAFAKELKKALVYHYGSRFPGSSLDAFLIGLDGPTGQAGAALESLGIPRLRPDWGPLAALPESFRVAGALAYRAFSGAEFPMSFSIPPPTAARSRRIWRGRAGILARTGYLALAGSALGVALLAISALGLRAMVASKARTWSGELQRWDAFQKRKASVDGQLGGMKGILARRTEAYAGMQNIAGLLPPEVWLESWDLEPSAGRGAVHRLEGYGLAEARVPEFLANLEKSRKFAAVKLRSTERIKAETAEQKTGIQANRKELVRFQIDVSQ